MLVSLHQDVNFENVGRAVSPRPRQLRDSFQRLYCRMLFLDESLHVQRESPPVGVSLILVRRDTFQEAQLVVIASLHYAQPPVPQGLHHDCLVQLEQLGGQLQVLYPCSSLWQ